MIRSLKHIHRRRRQLRRDLELEREFELWEETCVPSYCHSNLLAAYVSWWRLFAAVGLAKRFGGDGPVLDFGASIGEVGHLIGDSGAYHYVEQDERPAAYLQKVLPDATRHTLESAPTGYFASVFALDALEHNDNYVELLDILKSKLAPNGVLVLSGPTENALYRLGRKIAGFSGHYHRTNIQMIEQATERTYRRLARKTVPFAMPLFRLSAWA